MEGLTQNQAREADNNNWRPQLRYFNLELFSWKTPSHKDHLEICLPNILLSGLLGICGLPLKLLYLTLFASIWCQFGTPCRFLFIWGMVFALNVRMLRKIGLSLPFYCSYYDFLNNFRYCLYLKSWEAALCSAGRSVRVQTISSKNSIVRFFKWWFPSKSLFKTKLLIIFSIIIVKQKNEKACACK